MSVIFDIAKLPLFRSISKTFYPNYCYIFITIHNLLICRVLSIYLNLLYKSDIHYLLRKETTASVALATEAVDQLSYKGETLSGLILSLPLPHGVCGPVRFW